MEPPSPTGTGRTQAERRARTRRAILAATIDALVDDGFAGVTTRAVARRAGVSVGAVQHHFASKAELVAASIEHLTAELTRELVAQTPTAGRSERELAEDLLDRLWAMHTGGLMGAMAELGVAARTDPGLRDRLTGFQRDGIAASGAVAEQMFPGAPGVASLLHTSLATMRGLAMLGFVDPAAAEAMWDATRRHLLTLLFDTPPDGRGT